MSDELTDQAAADATARLRIERINKPCPLADPSSVSRELAVALAREFSPEDITRRIRELCDAKRMTKHGLEDDVRAREAGLKLMLAYKEGLPLQRAAVHTTTDDGETDEETLARFLRSPALRKNLREFLDQAEAVEVQTVV
jgi:hypothetical protein